MYGSHTKFIYGLFYLFIFLSNAAISSVASTEVKPKSDSTKNIDQYEFEVLSTFSQGLKSEVEQSYDELLIGCGRRRDKILNLYQGRERWTNLTTLDNNADHNPDVVWDLMQLPYPFPDNTFDEIHAYEVLEHTGSQGDHKFFFAQFTELWRILKPNGLMFATCPSKSSIWALGDPSHTRIIQRENFVFLDQSEYTAQIGITPMSDFRYLYKADFSLMWDQDDLEVLRFLLKAVKPSRIST